MRHRLFAIIHPPMGSKADDWDTITLPSLLCGVKHPSRRHLLRLHYAFVCDIRMYHMRVLYIFLNAGILTRVFYYSVLIRSCARTMAVQLSWPARQTQ